MYVKICGLRDGVTAAHAIRAGADAIGVVMSEGSPRNASQAQALEVLIAARTTAAESEAGPGIHVDTVLVVRHMPAVDAARLARDTGFDVLQLHGPYTREDFRAAAQIHPRIWRATSIAKDPHVRAGEYDEERLLLDSPLPGSGETWDATHLKTLELGDSWLLAGGLSPANVAESIARAQPGGVDVSSGVESAPGIKSLDLITEFIEAARSA